MSLLDLWQADPKEIENKKIQQIIAFSGTGKLGDGNECSKEFRDFLSRVPSAFLVKYAEQCLNDSFSDSGFVLQDIINEIGARLGFNIQPGRYRGTSNEIGYDGIWMSPNDHAIIVEVKTTDAYRIDLNRIAAYRNSLIKDGKIREGLSSFLIIVGRKDTGDLEAQIRGSRYGWDMRLISVDALTILMKLKEEVEDPKIIKQINEILIPREFTKLDEIIQFLFSTAEEVKEEILIDEEAKTAHEPKFVPVSFHDACIVKLQIIYGKTLVRKSKASYVSSDGSIAQICTVSRAHADRKPILYWFAFHPYQKDFLGKYKEGYIAFGCGSENQLFNIPFSEFSKWLDDLNITEKNGKFYWHVHIIEEEKRF